MWPLSLWTHCQKQNLPNQKRKRLLHTCWPESIQHIDELFRMVFIFNSISKSCRIDDSRKNIFEYFMDLLFQVSKESKISVF